MRGDSEEGSYLRLVDSCITQLQAESNKEERRRRGRVGLGWGSGRDSDAGALLGPGEVDRGRVLHRSEPHLRSVAPVDFRA